MGWNTRHWAKRKLGMMKGNNETACQHAAEIAVRYKDQHPQIEECLRMIVQGYSVLDDLIDTLDNQI